MDNTNMMVFTKEECVELASVLKKAIVSELMDIKFDVDKYTDSERIAKAYDILLRTSLEEITGFIDRVEELKKWKNHGYKGYLHYNEHNKPIMIVKELVIEIAGEPVEKYYLAKYKIHHDLDFDIYGMKVYTEEELNTLYEQQKECLRLNDTKRLNNVISSIKVTEITKEEYTTLVNMGLSTFGDQSIFDFFTEVCEDK